MKTNSFLLLQCALFLIFFTQESISQDSLDYEFKYEIKRVIRPLAITKDNLEQAVTLLDINQYYYASWVSDYIDVNIITLNNNIPIHTSSKNDTLTCDQKDALINADIDSDINVKVNYIPKNQLQQNDAKEFNFTFRVDPNQEAYFKDGHNKLKEYLKTNAIDKIDNSKFKQYQLTVIKFTVEKDGAITNVYVSESSDDDAIDNLLIDTVRNMTTWQPAQYENGSYIAQEFAFIIGDFSSCIINTINIDKT